MRRLVRTVMVAFFATSFLMTAGVVFAEQGAVTKPGTKTVPGTSVPAPGKIDILKGKCCIAGLYVGSKTDSPTPTATCPAPEPTKKFSAIITQGAGCGAEVSIVVTEHGGHVTNLKGTLGPKSGDCCVIEGTSVGGGDDIKMKGKFCKKGLKWVGSGTFTSKSTHKTCSGTWEMTQK